VLLKNYHVTKIIVGGDAGVVHKQIEGVDLGRRRVDALTVGQVDSDLLNPRIGMRPLPSRRGINPRSTLLQRLLHQRFTDATVSARDQNRLSL